MNERLQLPVFREKFLNRQRRSVPVARAFAREALGDWGLAPRADDVLLCVSELATNALLHGVPPGRGFLVRLAYDGHVLRVELHDSGDGEPHIPCEARDEGGHGLLLVSALADKWGVGARVPGKVVWCEFQRPARPRLTPP
ncbi:ATP-binding protein [Streptomyces cavernicola]|uniref:ATP-binding protein n=1 Tax=Streptomyces cavernicola TaxID=3043613 RepID=A0ABT6SJR2_9ACTN|nr:ATP-binding protein [Streptomyces sp. B-S-A6]MDI3408433.1 ATP-binding protein [Streptomyces sp. B-S-A6]